MKILAAINNENITKQLKKIYIEKYNEDLEIKDVYYFKSLLEEAKATKYDRIIVLEELEPYDTQNMQVINEKMINIIDRVSDDNSGTPIIFIAADDRKKNENFIVSLFNMGVYNILLGNDRRVDNLIALINKPRTKKQAKEYIDVKSDFDVYKQAGEVDSAELSRVLMSFDKAKAGGDPIAYVDIFNKIVEQYTDLQLKTIVQYLTPDIRQVLNENSSKYRQVMNLGQKEEPVGSTVFEEEELKRVAKPEKEVVEKVVEKEVIKEVPKEIIKEVEVVKQVYGLPKDYRKVITFIGGSNVGKTFIINAVASNLAKQGIKVAILDMTMNKDEYFIYAINEEMGRETAIKSLQLLSKGEDKPFKRRNLSVYTGLPKQPLKEKDDYMRMVDTVQLENSVILIDCDYDTPIDLLKVANNIYLVQDMNMLEIQAITDYLKEIKDKGVNLNKLKIVINKYIKCSLTPKRILESLSYYSNPEMTIYDELFYEDIPYYILPYDTENLKLYISGLLNCNVNFDKFTDEFKKAMDEIVTSIYQTGNKQQKKGLFNL